MNNKTKRGRPTEAPLTERVYARVTEAEHERFIALGGSEWLRKQLAPAQQAESAEPVAWQYRWRAVRDDGTLGDWNEWQPGRAPKMRTNIYQQQERPLFAHPSPADEALREDAARYRWLRDPCSGAERVIFYCRGDYGRGLMSGSMLDAAIDAAMQRASGGDHE